MTSHGQPSQVLLKQVQPSQVLSTQVQSSQVQMQPGMVQYSAMAAMSAAAGANTPGRKVQRRRQGPGEERQLRESVLEENNDGFQLVQGRRKKQARKVQYGTGKTDLGDSGGEATPN